MWSSLNTICLDLDYDKFRFTDKQGYFVQILYINRGWEKSIPGKLVLDPNKRTSRSLQIELDSEIGI